MQLSLIAAMSENRVIGIKNGLPWHLSADLKRFKKLTMGKPILMGRKTFDSIGRPLPGRTNIIVSRDKTYHPDGCVLYNSLEVALKELKCYQEVMVIGGAELYHCCFPLAKKLYLTLLHHKFDGDTFFPKIELDNWSVVEKIDFFADLKNQFNYSFLVYEKTA